jgi:hypothetical protein
MVVTVSLAAVGCGSEGSEDVTAGGSSTSTSTSAVATTAAPTTVAATSTSRPPTAAADKATAQRILLTAADVPSMATAKPAGFFEIYARCGRNQLLPGGTDPRQATPVAFIKDETAEVRRAQTTILGAYAALAPSEDAARAVVATVQSRDFRSCMERELGAAVSRAQGVTTTDLPTPAIADGVAGFRTTVAGTTVVGQEFEITAVRKGRALAFAVTSRLSIPTAPFPTDERVRLPRVMAGRMP